MGRFDTQSSSSVQSSPEHRRFSAKETIQKANERIFGEEKPSEPTPLSNKGTLKGSAYEIHPDAIAYTKTVLNSAIGYGASDVHFEPRRDTYQVRFRVDGVLRQFDIRPIDEYQGILNSIKVLSDMDIAEHATPQDGHIEMVQEEVRENATEISKNLQKNHPLGVKNHYYDIRVSVFPSVNGEVVVMRVLNRDSALLTIEELGMDGESLARLTEALRTSFGMVLVTGPTGSGKTTTLYSILSELRNDEKNIITLEDPIEFHLDWLRQCEIREERGFTFEKAMESVLRQDPDILMVGEIRDPHTAEHAVRSALVGRIVGSTIHANTAIGTIARLLELGITRSIIGHTLNAIIAQRLVRRTCDACKEEYTPLPELLKHFELDTGNGPFYRGRGCAQCNNTGYVSRTGLFSLMTFDDNARNILFDQRPFTDLEEYSMRQGMRTLRMDAALKIVAGTITVEEASRVI